jgi:hypothetical protein
MTSTYAGIGDCPDCGVRVLFAVDVAGDLVPLDEGQDGPALVRWDSTDTPRARDVPHGYQRREGEHRFRLHRDSCAALARVIPISVPARLRRTGANRRYA